MCKTDFEQTNVQMNHLIAGDLVQWSRPSVGGHVILLNTGIHYVVLRPLAWTRVGQLD